MVAMETKMAPCGYTFKIESTKRAHYTCQISGQSDELFQEKTVAPRA